MLVGLLVCANIRGAGRKWLVAFNLVRSAAYSFSAQPRPTIQICQQSVLSGPVAA